MVQLIQRKCENFAAFLKKDNGESTTNEKRDYATFAYRIISKALNLIPTDSVENPVQTG
jgi:hypothetical protein